MNQCLSAIAGQKNVGRLGVSILDLESGSKYGYNGREHFPLQSVFKAPIAFAVLKQVDSGKLSLSQKITIKKADLSIYHSPLRDEFSASEQPFAISELIRLAVQESDNTAGDVLLGLIGGPKKLTEELHHAGIDGITVTHYERQFQPCIFGLPPFEPGQEIDLNRWQQQRKEATGPSAQKAFDYYIKKDIRDVTTPEAMVCFFNKLYQGQLLSGTSTRYLLDVLSGVMTGTHRLRQALPQGTILAHKTGTGPDFKGVNSATNDAGIVTLPSGKRFIIAVFLCGSSLNEEERDKVIRDVAGCALSHFQ